MKNNKRKIIFCLCGILFLCCIGYIIWYYKAQADNSKVYDKLQEQSQPKEEAKETKPKEQTPDEPTPEEDVQIPVDFKELQDINPDIYAWIEIPGTEVNYPIAQSSSDDAYYLNHTIEGKSGLPGSIYTESVNSKDFSDFNTVIYGHNMKDGSMFHGLHGYMDKAFFDEHPTVYIYTPDKVLEYEIFASVVYDDRHLMKAYDFKETSHRKSFLESIDLVRDMKSNHNENITVDENDHIITLSTCITGQDDNRYLVEAVLKDE